MTAQHNVLSFETPGANPRGAFPPARGPFMVEEHHYRRTVLWAQEDMKLEDCLRPEWWKSVPRECFLGLGQQPCGEFVILSQSGEWEALLRCIHFGNNGPKFRVKGFWGEDDPAKEAPVPDFVHKGGRIWDYREAYRINGSGQDAWKVVRLSDNQTMISGLESKEVAFRQAKEYHDIDRG